MVSESLKGVSLKGVEVDLCGHATLASAHILYEEGMVSKTATITFHTKSGPLFVAQKGNMLAMDFPTDSMDDAECPTLIRRALGVEPVHSLANEKRYLLRLSDTAAVVKLRPDFSALRKIKKGFIVTAPSDDRRFDFVSRFFAPCVGIDEDPVTGSAHCALAPYWRKQLGKKTMSAYQASERSGIVHCVLEDNGRVILSGEAVTVFATNLRLPG